MKTVAYCRLSKDDGNGESSSISNQKKIIKEFADNNDFIIDEYLCDDGWSGFSMQRPAFDKLKEYLNNDEVDTIIVKDLSRIGRHNAKVQLFLENVQEVGKRVISISENYDTFNEDSQVTTGIHTWANENFIKMTSKKIRKSITTLQKEGKWICSVPYGYVKDDFDKTKYIVDTITSPYVKMIFDLYIDGMGLKKIAKELTDQHIPTPSMIKKQRLEAKGRTYKPNVTGKWDVTVISRILANEFYIGTLTLGKSKKRSINGKSIEVPKEERYVFKNAHEPIIDKQTFELAQEITKQRSFGNYRGKKIQTRPNIFAGVLYCSDCGKKLTSAGGKNNTRYICRTYNIYGTNKCTSHAITENDIKDSLIEFLEYCRDNLHNVIDDIDNIIQAEIQVKGSANNNIELLSKQLINAKNELKVLMEQKVRETMKNPSMVDMIDQMYNEMQNDKYKEIQSLEKQLETQQDININEVEIKNSLNKTLSIINEIIDNRDLTKKEVLTLIDKIIVHEDSGIDIYLKGDLHEICNNYFKVSENRMNNIKKYMYEYIIDNQEKFITNNCTVYVRSKGIKLTYKTVSKIIKEELLENGLVEIRPMNHGYKVICTQEELQRKLLGNNVVGTSRSRSD